MTMAAGAPSSGGAPAAMPAAAGAVSDGPPIIASNGDNPATIKVSESYADSARVLRHLTKIWALPCLSTTQHPATARRRWTRLRRTNRDDICVSCRINKKSLPCMYLLPCLHPICASTDPLNGSEGHAMPLDLFSRKLVLLVEDEPLIALDVERHLRTAGAR